MNYTIFRGNKKLTEGAGVCNNEGNKMEVQPPQDSEVQRPNVKINLWRRTIELLWGI